MRRMENFIEKKLEECQISPQLLAAALLKMNMGEDIYGITEEITVELPKKKMGKRSLKQPENNREKSGKSQGSKKGRGAFLKKGEKEEAKWLKKDKKAVAKEWLKKEKKHSKKKVK